MKHQTGEDYDQTGGPENLTPDDVIDNLVAKTASNLNLAGPEEDADDDDRRQPLEDRLHGSEVNVFDRLPDEVVSHLLTFVDVADPTNLGVLDVCSRFRRLWLSHRTGLVLTIQSPKYFHYSSSPKAVSPRVARTVLSHCPRLKELELTVTWHSLKDAGRLAHGLAIHALQSCPKLTCLKGVHCRDAKMTRNILEAVEEHGGSLVELHLEGADFSQLRASEKAARAMEGLRIVDVLDLGDEFNRWNAADYLSSPGVETVESRERSLKILKLSGVPAGSALFAVLGQHCQILEVLSVDLEDLDQAGLMSISLLPNLKYLDIHSCWIESRFFADAFRGRKMAKLVHLNVSNNNYGLDDAALTVVAENCPDLEELLLRNCYKVTDVGIRSAVLHCGKLRRLELGGIPGVSRSTLEDVGVRLPSLEHLGKPMYEGEQ